MRRLPVLFALLALAACQKPAATAEAGASAATASAAGAHAIASTSTGATAALPGGTVTVSARTAVISLPYRSAEGLIWVSATRMADADPWMFKGLEIKPGAGPDGTDLAVFTYAADKAGKATLKFGLVPPGKMLIGPPAMVYTGPVAKTWQAEVATS